MSDKYQDEFGSVQATHRMWLFFDKHVQLLGQAHAVLIHERVDRWGVLVPLSLAIQDSCDSISVLARQGKMRDCFVLARTVFETIINFCFICAKGDEAARRARRHAMQKAYRDLRRELKINQQKLSLHWSGKIDLSVNPDLQAALTEFTSSKGREITSWTPETVKEQLEAIEAKYGENVATPLQFALLAIYRHASEIAHGTLFGALFALDLTSPSGPPCSPEVLANHQRQNITMLLLVLGFSISSMLQVLAHELPLDSLVSESEAAIKDFEKEQWLR